MQRIEFYHFLWVIILFSLLQTNPEFLAFKKMALHLGVRFNERNCLMSEDWKGGDHTKKEAGRNGKSLIIVLCTYLRIYNISKLCVYDFFFITSSLKRPQIASRTHRGIIFTLPKIYNSLKLERYITIINRSTIKRYMSIIFKFRATITVQELIKKRARVKIFDELT